KGRLAMDPAQQISGPLRYNLGPGDGRVINSDVRTGFNDYIQGYTFDASLVARTAAETRPSNVSGVWTVQAFGAVTNPGAADAAQLASDYAVLNAAFQTLDGQFQTLRAQVFGASQTMQSMIGSRAFGVTYINSTGRPVAVYASGVTASAAGGNLFLSIDGVMASRGISTANAVDLGVHGIVPPGAAYVVISGNVTFVNWKEYR
ncbi:phage tail protein, partial [Ralstonia pseudosolanacearum]